MGIFIGDMKCSTAARCGLKINWAVKNIVQPGIISQYGVDKYTLLHKVGIDHSTIMAARTGIRGANDIVWVGTAANHAAKLCSMDDPGYSTFITDRVYKKLHNDSKYGGANKVDMWEARDFNGLAVYRSNYWWSIA
jgi:class 3 adenylate cyclase